MRDVFVARLVAEAAIDERINLITGDLGFGVLDKFWNRFPKRFLNAGVAEQLMTSVATGLALEGRIVCTYSIANFPILRCLEQIRNDAAYHDANVKVVSIGGGFSYGALGMSHHATEDLAILRALPQVTVFTPSCDWEAAECTSAMLRHPGVCYLRLDKSTAGDTSRPGEVFEVGAVRRIREGSDLTIVTCGGILGEVLKAVEVLSSNGISVRVLAVPTLKPLHTGEVLAASRETGGILTVEEHVLTGGLGSTVAEVLLDSGATPRRFARMGIEGGYSSIVGSQDYLRSRHGLDAPGISQRVRALVGAVSKMQERSPVSRDPV